MPDHWHGLIELGEEALSRVVGRAKACAAREWKQHDDRKLWAPGFHDRAVRSHQNLHDVARYIVANPLRAGLVDRIGDYPYRDAIWIEG